MGSNRNLVILVVLLVVLGGTYMLTSQQRSHMDNTGGFRDVVEGPLSTDDVFGIEAYRGENREGGVVMSKRGTDWVLTNHHDAPANENKIRTLLGNLESMEGEFRSDDAGVLGDYQLEDANALHVVVKGESGADLHHFLVGKSSGSGGFVRTDGSNEALLASHNLRSDFGMFGEDQTDPDRASWIDLVVFELDRNEAASLDLKSSEFALVMNKEFPEVQADSTGAQALPDPSAYEWRVTVPESFQATKTQADAILNSLTNLRARDIAGRDMKEEYGLGDDADRVTVTMKDSTQHTLRFGRQLPDDESQCYFQVEGEDIVWTMQNYIRQNVFKDPKDLKPE